MLLHASQPTPNNAWPVTLYDSDGNEIGTVTNPFHVDLDGNVVQVADNGGSLTVDTVQLPALLVGGRLDTNTGAWLGSTAPTVGQKASADSLPVVLASDQTVSVSAVSLPLPTGAATQATLATLLTEAAFAARINTQGQKASAASTPVVLASDQSAIPVTDNGGSLTLDTPQLPAALVAGRLDNNVGAWLGSTAPSVGQKTSASSVPVVLSSDQSAIPVSAVTLPLPAGAATEATLSTRLTESMFTARINTLGQKVATASTPVVLASDQSTLPISATSLPLPTGAATETTLGTRVAESTFTSRINTQGQKTSAASTPVVLSSDQSVIPVAESQLLADEATFGFGATKVYPAGYILDESATGSIAENDIGASRMDSKRAAVVVMEDSITRGARPRILSVNPAQTDPGLVIRPIERIVPRYYVVFDRIVPGLNKYMATVFNTSVTRKVLIQSISVYNWQLAAAAGGLLNQYIARITARTAGTSVIIRSEDTLDALSAGITADTNSLVVTEDHIVRRFWASNDEYTAADTGAEHAQAIFRDAQILYKRGPNAPGLTLRQNQGISIRNETTTVAGSVSYIVEFTDEAV